MIAIFQPALFFLLMSFILVHPTMDMYLAESSLMEIDEVAQAMRDVGSPIGEPYINPVLVEEMEVGDRPELISGELREGVPTLVQRFGLVDSNQVKNLRNRLTAAALRLWNGKLGEKGVTIVERPWLPEDVPYTVYFGMAMLPMAAFMSAYFVGGVLIGQEFEFRTILEYYLAPAAPLWILGTRLVRLVLTSALSAGMLLLLIGLRTERWPNSIWRTGLILLPMGLIGGGLGSVAGIVLRRSIPTLVTGLVLTLGLWILGGAFGLTASFGGLYELAARISPNTYAVDLLFSEFFGAWVGSPTRAAVILVVYGTIVLSLLAVVYWQRVIKVEA
jgi:ABC-type multidrug transport system permease subunit